MIDDEWSLFMIKNTESFTITLLCPFCVVQCLFHRLLLPWVVSLPAWFVATKFIVNHVYRVDDAEEHWEVEDEVAVLSFVLYNKDEADGDVAECAEGGVSWSCEECPCCEVAEEDDDE